MGTRTTTDPAVRLAELEQAHHEARHAERDARDEHSRRLQAVTAARAELTRACATGDGIEAAEAAYEEAQKAAGDGSLPARIEGLAQASHNAAGAVQRHREGNLAALVDAVRPRAEAAVQAIYDRAEELRAALGEYHAVSRELGGVTKGVQWFELHRQMPAAPVVEALTRDLDPCRLEGIPVPMPRSLENPADEQERLRREHAAKLAGAHERRAAKGSASWHHPMLEEAS